MDSASALAAYNSFQAPDAATVLSTAQSKYGIPDLQKKVSDYRTLTGNLTSAIAAVDPSVTGRTAGTLTTEGQRSALVSRERAPVVGQLGTANSALDTASRDYTTADANSRSEADMTVKDNEAKRARLLDTYNIANAREEAQRKAAAEAAAAAENKRQFDAQLAASQAAARSGGGGGGGGGKASAADTKAAVQQHVASNLAGSTGKDGYVSNETFAAALSDYQAAGLGNVRAFWQNYGRYVNPKYKSSYAGYAQR